MLIQLFRVRQWYKNLLVFLPLVFVGLATDEKSILLSILAFFALCMMSSVNYIINDIIDREKDKVHPEKKERPLASGKISLWTAGTLAGILAVVSLSIGIVLSFSFFLILLLFFFLTLLYSVYFKEELFADTLFIAVNFVLRAAAGAYVLHVRISPWLIVCTFFLSFFIAVGKRRAEYKFLEEKAPVHKKVLASYGENITGMLMAVATTALLMSYSLYSFLSVYPHLIYTLPFAFYVILRYLFLVESASVIARSPEYFYKDTRLITGIALWCLAVLVVIY
ncbi:UbiA prenyltransferase family protein [Candidatus Woesearchaeota archaeon]|nr:UbiA prenyltransferase family protein [Candidatus Woesearchaeota archaeon]